MTNGSAIGLTVKREAYLLTYVDRSSFVTGKFTFQDQRHGRLTISAASTNVTLIILRVVDLSTQNSSLSTSFIAAT